MKHFSCALFSLCIISLQGASDGLTTVSSLLAARLVTKGSGSMTDESGSTQPFVTEPVQQLLEMSKTKVDDFSLSAVVEATQKAWIRADWKFKDGDIAEDVDVRATTEHVNSLFMERIGSFTPRVLCQGGGLGTALQTFAALCMVAQQQSIEDVTYVYRNLPVHFTESRLHDYEAVLRILGKDSEKAILPQSHSELVKFFQEVAYPELLKEVHIRLVPVEDKTFLDEWKERNRGAFCVVAAPFQAAASVQSLQATFPDITITGVQTIGARGAELCEPLYGETTTPKQQLAVRLHHIGRELFFIDKNQKA